MDFDSTIELCTPEDTYIQVEEADQLTSPVSSAKLHEFSPQDPLNVCIKSFIKDRLDGGECKIESKEDRWEGGVMLGPAQVQPGDDDEDLEASKDHCH